MGGSVTTRGLRSRRRRFHERDSDVFTLHASASGDVRAARRPFSPPSVSVGEADLASPRRSASVTDLAVIGGSARIAEIAALAETADASTGPALEAVEAGGTTLTVRDGRAAERGALRGNAIASPVNTAIERPALRAHVAAALA